MTPPAGLGRGDSKRKPVPAPNALYTICGPELAANAARMRFYAMTKRHDWTKPFDTTIEIDGVEMDAAVFYHYQPAEPDVNVGAAVEIESVIFEDQGDVSDQMTDRQIEELAEHILTSQVEDRDDYGDWRYQQRKDDRLTGDL